MNYFNYSKLLKVDNPYRSYLIYNQVYNSPLVNYARAIYGTAGANDALDNAFQIILMNYDADKGDLEHYATRTIKTIDLNKGRHEIPNTDMQVIIDAEKSHKQDFSNPLNQVLDNLDRKQEKSRIAECAKELLPFFLIDFKFFTTYRKSDKILDYDRFYEKYSVPIFDKALTQVRDDYTEKVESLYKLRSKVSYRALNKQKYEKCLEKTLTYVGETNGIVLYNRNKSKTPKKTYIVDLKGIVNDLKMRYYNSSDLLLGVHLNEERNGYCSLSGKLATDYKMLGHYLEDEVVQAILTRLPLCKVLNNCKGKLILVSTKDLPITFEMKVLEDTLHYSLVEVPAKAVM